MLKDFFLWIVSGLGLLLILGLFVYISVRLGSVAWFKTKQQFDRISYFDYNDYEPPLEEENYRGKKQHSEDSIH
jgi:hypothetical protein